MSVIASSSSSTSQTTEIYHSIDKSVHLLSAVKKAALKFTDICSFDFKDGGTTIEITMTVQSDLTEDAQQKILSDFKTEILDQELRESIAKETEPVRNLILANVFSRAVTPEDSE